MHVLTIVLVIVLIIVLLALPVLQRRLSKSSVKWSGLILPVLFAVIDIAILIDTIVSDETAVSVIGWIIMLVYTALHFAIYFICRSEDTRKKQLEKMNINDLG